MKTATAPQSPVRRGRQARLLLTLLTLFAVLALIAYNRQGISDAIQLRGYNAPAAVSAIASADTMTAQARRVFYVNQPDIANKTSFAKQCPSSTEQSVVLGCYHGDQSGIFVLAVTDTRLKGVEEVTSAHELLHAAYDRLNARQKKQLDAQLLDYFNHDLKDQAIKDQINSYKQSEPTELVNEMHSILGTEVPNLPAPLEAYYKRYFTNRSAITGFYTNYENEFTSRQATIKADDTQLATLKSQIIAANASLKDQSSTLAAREVQLNALRAAGSISAYNAQVPGYNVQVNSYNAQVGATRTLIDQYNQLVAARNAIVLESQQLTNEINSSVLPASR